LIRTATREAAGAISRSSSSCLLAISGPASKVMPVMFPPGRARLATKPSPTASALASMTIGIVAVADLLARVAAEEPATITSTLSCRSSPTSAGSRSTLPSANRVSMMMFRPSIHPSSPIVRRNAASTSLPESALLNAR
jgi:hypothetical protein